MWKKWSESVSCSVVSDSVFFATIWTVALQAPLSMEFSRQEHWSGLPFSCPGDFPDLGIKPRFLALRADSSPSESPGKTFMVCTTLIYQIMQNYFSKCLRQFLISLTLYEMSSSWPALSIVRILANLTGLKRYFLILICISLITDQFEHLFVFMLIHFFEFTLLVSPIIHLLFDFSSWILEILHIV